MTALVPPVDPGELHEDELELEFVDFGSNKIHRVPTYNFRMVNVDLAEVVGSIRLRVGSTPHVELYAGHIGYTVLPEYRGHRYAARSLRLLVPLARRVGLDPLWITCDPENAASRRSLELAGAHYVETVNVPADCVIYHNGHPRKSRYRL